MNSPGAFTNKATLYYLRRAVQHMCPYGENLHKEYWKINRFQAVPHEGCPVPQISEPTEVLVGDLITYLALCREVLELEGVWDCKVGRFSATLSVTKNGGRLSISDQELLEYIDDVYDKIRDQEWRFV